MIQGLNAQPTEFYTALKQVIGTKQIDKVKFDEVYWSEGGGSRIT